jgi:hypothetical protein
MSYDMVLFGCWGQTVGRPANELAAFVSYVNAGGHAYATHYAYDWLDTNGEFTTALTWDANYNSSETATANNGTIAATSPELVLFQQWAEHVGAANATSQISLAAPKDDVSSVVAPSEAWITGTDTMGAKPQVFLSTIPTPYPPPTTACGRVAFADFHANSVASKGTTFPAECSLGALAPTEQVVEYMIWNLAGTTCAPTASVPPTCTPKTCADQQFTCGGAGDGCGGSIQCGICTPPQTCGGGGFNKCG